METAHDHRSRRFPGDVLRIFVGATSADLHRFRIRVRDVLEQTGQIFADIQDMRPPDFKDIEVMLQNHVGRADAIICLIGQVYGSEPPGSAAHGPARRSYTQREFDMACNIEHMPVFRFIATDDAELDRFDPEPEELRILQQKFRREVQGKREQYTQFKNIDELEDIVKQATYRIDDIWEARRLRRFGQPGENRRLDHAAPLVPQSLDAWKQAVGLVVSGQEGVQRALGTAFCVAKAQFLATSVSVSAEVDAALHVGTPVSVLWEKHPRGLRQSRVDRSWPGGLLRIAGADGAGAELVPAEPDSAFAGRIDEPLTALPATTPQIAYADWRVQIERIVGIIADIRTPHLHIHSASPELTGAALSGAPLVGLDGTVAAIIESAAPSALFDGHVIEARGVAEFRAHFPYVLSDYGRTNR